jgi:hypothetical protein
MGRFETEVIRKMEIPDLEVAVAAHRKAALSPGLTPERREREIARTARLMQALSLKQTNR